MCILAAAAQAQLQITAEYSVENAEQQAAAQNVPALATNIASAMGSVYEAAGIPMEEPRYVDVNGVLVPVGKTPAPATPPPPPPPPPPPRVVEDSSSDNTGLVVAALVIGVVGLVGVVAWYVLRRPSAVKVKLPPEIPYRIKPKTQPSPEQPQPQPYCPAQPQQPQPYYPAQPQPQPQQYYPAQPQPQPQPYYPAQPQPQYYQHQPDYYYPQPSAPPEPAYHHRRNKVLVPV
jgi:hypothetical protein